ncbi:MAG: efflux transporter outer membrane subunit [Hyphomonadaceae bacterium]
MSAAWAAALLVSACAVLEPHYERPGLPVPNQWPDSAATLPAGSTALPEWRAFFTDQKLQTLIGMALEENRDLRVAALNIERARSQYRIQRAQSLPAIDAVATGQIDSLTIAGDEAIERQYSAGAGVTAFELDLFGRVRGLNRAALQTYLATADARDSVQISLIAEAATAYLTYAGDLELLRLAQDTLTAQQQSLDLTRQRFEAGASSQLDLNRAQTIVETARADVARYTAQTARDENALALLIGAPVPTDLRPTTIDAVAFGAAELPAGLPSEVLLNRPDIRESEHLLRAANADIGAARAAFFPSVTISAFGGETDPRFENLFQGSANEIWSFTPQINIPIFRGGALLAGLGVANADRDIAVAQYERAIQAAFREVADALATRAAIDDELAARQALTEAAGGSYTLSEARYREGIDNYLSLLDAQRELYAAQQGLVSARVAQATSLVTLYKALGGGER